MIQPNRILDIARTLAPGGGTYVEAGANDGLRQSNTLLLEQELGWTGVLIEPSPAAFHELVSNRPNNHLIQAALVAEDSSHATVQGAFRDGTLTGTIDERLYSRVFEQPRSTQEAIVRKAKRFLGMHSNPALIVVPTSTLSRVLDITRVAHPDILSLDVEGYELQALKGIDFSRHAPSVLIIEVRRSDTWDILELLAYNNYACVENLSRFADSDSGAWTQDHEDYLFVRRDVLAAHPTLCTVLFGRVG